MRRLLVLIATLLAIGAVVPWSLHADARPHGPVVALGLPRTIDPAQAARLDEFRLITALFEPLVRLVPGTLQPEPALAATWETSADRLTWTFHLQPHATWSDGHAVTAQDMRRGLLRHLIVQSPNAFYLDGIIAGASCSEQDPVARQQQLESCGIRCPDEHTLTLTLTHPVPYLAAILSLSAFVPATQAQAVGADLRSQAQVWNDPTQIVGNGPMVCTGYLARHHYDFAPNPHYAGVHAAHGTVRALIVENPGTALRLYLSCQVDAILLLPADAVHDIELAHMPGLLQATSLSTSFLRIRLISRQKDDQPAVTAALHNPAFRRALARSVDRAALVNGLLLGDAVPASTFVPAELGRYLPYQAPIEILASDQDAAARELATARQVIGTLPDLELIVPSQPAERLSVAEFVVDGWRRRLGITVTLLQMPQTELRAHEIGHQYDLDYANWLGDFLDPTTFLDCFRTEGGANRTGYADQVYDHLLDRAARSDGAERWSALQEAERHLLADPPLIPLFHGKCSFLVRPGLGGITANPLEIVYFDELTGPETVLGRARVR
jgi:oligopeptide transport system substrate-binding protein